MPDDRFGALPFYRMIIAADFEFEFGGVDGNLPRPVCMVARELRTGQTWKIWRGDFGETPPFPTGPDVLFVAYYASAELGCFKVLGWKMPERVLDLFAEFRNLTNGIRAAGEPNGLIDALDYYALDLIGAHYKKAMIDRILAGPPYSHNEVNEIFDYCEGDVLALDRLLPAMLPHISLGHALLRGRFMAAAAAIEHAGVPIDAPLQSALSAHRDTIKHNLIREGDTGFGVFDERGVFKQALAEKCLARLGIPWKRLPSGALDLEDETFEQAAITYPIIKPLWKLRQALSGFRLNDLQVGSDGRNRCLLSAFRARTGRNQPSNTKFIFGPAVWIRSLIKPPPGYGVAYIDWVTQEIGICAVLSGDERLIEAYNSGDVYIAFGKQSGRWPAGATKESHHDDRQILKQCVLGIGYGMEAQTLAARIRQPEFVARELLRDHRRTYQKFWKWSDAAVDTAMQGQILRTVFDWRIRVGDDPNPRSLRNFPAQANASEMLRLACCLGTERGVEIVAPIHDAVLICAPLDRLDNDIATMLAAMNEASRTILGGFELRTDVHVVKYPDRYVDAEGVEDWNRVMRLLAQAEQGAA